MSHHVRLLVDSVSQRHKIALSLVLGLILVGISSITTVELLAYNDYGNFACSRSYSGGTSTLDVVWRNDTYLPPTGAYDNAFSAKRTAWDNADTPAEFDYQSANHGNYLLAYDYGDDNGSLGKTTVWCTAWETWLGSEAVLNKYHLDSATYTLKSQVALHELGHFIGLGHTYDTDASMYEFASYELPITPQEDDECAVNDIYENSLYSVTC